jgi:hypothetical protein
MNRITASIVLLVGISAVQPVHAMSWDEYVQMRNLQNWLEEQGVQSLAELEAKLDAEEAAAQAAQAAANAGKGLGVAGGAAVAGSTTAIGMSAWWIYWDWQYMKGRDDLLDQMQNPPPQQPGQPYYNPSVPLDLFDPWQHVSNYWYYMTHPFAG